MPNAARWRSLRPSPGSAAGRTRHYDEPARAALNIAIATINAWNRVNVTTRQVAGTPRRRGFHSLASAVLLA